MISSTNVDSQTICETIRRLALNKYMKKRNQGNKKTIKKQTRYISKNEKHTKREKHEWLDGEG